VTPDDLRIDGDDDLVGSFGSRVRIYSTQMATPVHASTWGQLKALYR